MELKEKGGQRAGGAPARPINQTGAFARLRSALRHPGSFLVLVLVLAAALFTVSMLLFIIWHIVSNGIAFLKPSLFEFTYNSINVSLFPALVTTFYATALALAVSAPVGILCAVYLVEYAKRGSRAVEAVRLATETLSGIPSIVYGLFGMLFFVTALGWGYSLLAGTLTLSIMILPLIVRSTEEALLSVPDSYREASFGLGAGRLRTVFAIVLPSAAPGILAGVILSIGRIVGETAALIYTAGTVAQIPPDVFASGRTLAIHMYVLSNEGLYTGQSYATAVVLLGVVFLLNALSGLAAKKLTKG